MNIAGNHKHYRRLRHGRKSPQPKRGILYQIEESDLVYLLVPACLYSQTLHIVFGGTQSQKDQKE